MARVTGIGGVFFAAKDPAALAAWYREHLGVDVQEWGGAIFPGRGVDAVTTWTIQPAGDAPFAPGTSQFMVNYRVDDLLGLLAALREAGCRVVGDAEESEFGAFGWVLDPEGNKIELWQPPGD
jgi:predicted enzyme related to lactoylglutathione lyase